MTSTSTKPMRIRQSRRAGFKLPPNCMSVARPSRYGNPFKAGVHGTREWCARRHREFVFHYGSGTLDGREWTNAGGKLEMLVALSSRDPEVIGDLRGHHLACYCPLEVECHADTLLELAN